MADIDFEQIKKLPPDKRVKVLQELQSQIEKLINDRKKEIEQAQNLLVRAKEELTILEEIEVPKARQINVEELFGKEEKEDKKGLEGIAKKGFVPTPEQLREHFEQKSVGELYQRINDVAADIRETGIITQYQENFLRAANYEMQDREKATQQHQYRPTEKALHQMTAAEKIIRNYLN